jgi:ribosomal protein S12 methylthiotransferase
MNTPVINVITLGCSKNIVDSEYLLSTLSAKGFEVVHDADELTDIAIVNTCGFINDAKEESINMILQLAQARKNGHIKKLFVIGCLSQRYKDNLKKDIPEVDEFFGVYHTEKLLNYLTGEAKSVEYRNYLTTPAHYAYIKIAEGCDRTCSFCAIPLIKGRFKSKKIEAIVDEVRELAKSGVKELLLVAQDLTYYGLDIYKERKLDALLEELVKVEGVEWIRLHYTYPEQFPPEVIDIMKKEQKICNYIDIPFQHINSDVLSNMRRGINKQKTYGLINWLREQIPDVALRTSLLVGHPGETEEAFQELMEFVSNIQFDKLGVFVYSHEEGTYAYKKLEDHIPDKVKQERADAIMRLQSDISYAKNKHKLGELTKVLIDRREENYAIGRSQYDSPEVDNEILVYDPDNSLHTGNFYSVRITDSDEYDLYGNAITRTT